MRMRIIFFICCVLLSNLAIAEMPKRGTLMETVKAEFGTPIRTSITVGQPPITRWYYETFTVAFEYEHVIHAFPRDRSVEELSQNNTDGLVIPDNNNTAVETKADSQAPETAEQTEPEEEPASSGSFFENTPNLIQ